MIEPPVLAAPEPVDDAREGEEDPEPEHEPRLVLHDTTSGARLGASVWPCTIDLDSGWL